MSLRNNIFGENWSELYCQRKSSFFKKCRKSTRTTWCGKRQPEHPTIKIVQVLILQTKWPSHALSHHGTQPGRGMPWAWAGDTRCRNLWYTILWQQILPPINLAFIATFIFGWWTTIFLCLLRLLPFRGHFQNLEVACIRATVIWEVIVEVFFPT